MKRRKAIRFITTVATLGASLLLGALSGHYYFSHNTVEAALRIDQLEADKQRLEESNERLEFVKDLAAEFSMNPHIVELVHKYSLEYVDPAQPEWRLVQTPEFMTHIMLSMIHAESKGKPKAVGDSGRARGLTQIWVSTAQQYGEVEPDQLLDPETNIRFSFLHFHHLLKRYRGNLALALYAWNRGSSKVDQLIRYGQPPGNGYGPKVYSASLSSSARQGGGD